MPLALSVIETLRTMPRFVSDAASGLARDDWSRPPAGGGFSMVEHACHLRDLEQEGYVVRIERMLREEAPVLEEFDGGRIAKERNYAAQDFRAAIDEFERARSKSVDLLRGLSDDQLGRLARFGPDIITLGQLVEMMLRHDAEHRQEIEELVTAI